MFMLICLLLTLSGYLLLDYYGFWGPSSLPSIFSIPGFPVVGNIFQVRNNPAKVCMKWSKKYGKSIFAIRLGNRRVVVVNSFKDVSELWKKSSVNSRPTQYTFHKLVSSTKGFTVGTTPFSDTYKRRKQVISSALNKKNIENLVDVLNREVNSTIRRIYRQNAKLNCQPSSNPYRVFEDIDLLQHFQYFTLRTSVYITYGFRLRCYTSDKELSDSVIKNENDIIKYRSPIANLPDFLPVLRFFPSKKVEDAKLVRDEYMKVFMDRYNATSKKSCLVQDYYFLQNHKMINYEELQSICLTMISAGLDNTPLNLNHLLGILSIYPKFQDKVVNQLLDLYGTTVVSWQQAGTRMDSTFTIALIKETLRHFTVLPLSLPRVTTKDIEYDGIIIPENSTLFMNAYAANHDPNVFQNPMEFDPYRWFKDRDIQKGLLSDKLINHFSFGKGVRMCSGNIIALKEMYMIVCRLLLCFKVKSPRDKRFRMELDPFKNNNNPKATSFDPKPFKYQLHPRVIEGSDDLYNMLHHFQLDR